MSPRSRLRLSVDSSRSDRELADSQQFYQYTQHSPNTNRVFVDSKGQPHDPDFMSHMFPDQSAYKKRKMEAEKARRISMGRFDQDDDDYNSDDDLMSRGQASTDPFRARSSYSYYASQQPRNHYSAGTSSYGSSSYSTPTPSWQRPSLLDDADADDTSPVSERFSLRGWRRKKDSTMPDSDDAWDYNDKSRRVLRRRRRDLEGLEEDDDENMVSRRTSEKAAEDCAPTCTEALKQSWQGFVLSYKLGVHRLKRRMFPRKPEPQSSTSPFLHGIEEKYILGGT